MFGLARKRIFVKILLADIQKVVPVCLDWIGGFIGRDVVFLL